jgi:hypothetical protein
MIKEMVKDTNASATETFSLETTYRVKFMVKESTYGIQENLTKVNGLKDIRKATAYGRV